ncbi:hypothetical protein AB2B41_07770 [Marimonas sp. MJW-29]|uniref:Type IV pilus biogenesis protein PilP n=1 Tax=Sulfitobacter sediminis TaxID=3234186 RepID=A0ABV3RKI6_9RHOB
MKPSFALSLSFDGIRLLYRAAGGWRVVGEVSLDSPDMSAELEVLRKTAAALEPGGVRSKLLLPNDQIKYLSIETPGLDEDARRQAARDALDGATPYAVADLSFDISAEGDLTHIAAVAKETLAEAEAFAVEHRFQPVSFAAVPGDQPYLGEPFFGQTQGAAKFLEPGESVEPDGIAVVVIGEIRKPVPTAGDAQEPAVAEPEEENSGDQETPTEDISLQEEEPPEAKTGKAAAAAARKAPETGVKVTEAVTAETPEKAPALPPLRSRAPEEKPDDQSAPPAIGFASRRAPDRRKSPSLGGVQREAPPPATEVPAFPDLTTPGANGIAAAEIVIEPDSASLNPPPEKEPRSGFLSRRKTKEPRQPGGKVISAPPAPALVDDGHTEQERMTIFGARKSAVGGKPRFLGLILTAVLLIFLAGVAAWASVFLDDGFKLSRLFGAREPEVVEVEPEAAPSLPEAIQQAPEMVQPEAEVITASLEPTLTEEDAAVLDALREPAQPIPPRELSEQEMEAAYAATGIWPRAPEAPPEPANLVDIEDLYLTGIDPVSTASDAIALPDPQAFATDEVLAAVASPPAAGTAFDLDAEGLVTPTAQGALSPDGYTVFLGAPPLKPPATPTRFQSEPQDTVIRSALAAFRPESRPTDLVENTERAQLDGLTRSELAALRPVLRPQSLQQEAEAQSASLAAIDTDEAVETALQTPSAFESPTRYAIAASIRPDTRPRNFARIVQNAQKSTENEEVRVASAAAVAPRTVQPKIPSTANVAKQATVKNAINLRQINLIGVYGKPSNRRALVRLSNGRYQKVVVGDRIDGGRVSAIGDNELRYTKRGRDLVLRMPR